jgi:subtilisin family serine protease/subtilisin-like proprotein convertase family protein
MIAALSQGRRQKEEGRSLRIGADVGAGPTSRQLSYFFLLPSSFCLLWAAFTPSALSQETNEVLFEFRMPHRVQYRLAPVDSAQRIASLAPQWLAVTQPGDTNQTLLGARIALQTAPGVAPGQLTDAGALPIRRVLGGDCYILGAPDALTAATEAARLAQLPAVLVSYPVMRRPLRLHGPYAALPDDTYYDRQWNFENRATTGASLGPDLNARAAWSFTRGQNVALAIVDDGIEFTHPEFAARAQHQLHFNFATSSTNGLPISLSDNHATAVAGLAAAEWNNDRGMTGLAPAAQIVSWKIFQGFNLAATDEQLMDMFQYQSAIVGIQNHSWGNSGIQQLAPTPLERIGISNAIALGRQGNGVIMVRSAGNGRQQLSDVNDDAYASDPRVIGVAAIRRDGRAASYSTPGACVLVTAPGGDNDANVFTTDRQGAAGFNTGSYPDDFADYVSSATVQGTSFSAPQIAGLVALLLATNPDLTYRDVQFILALASRHFDLADPDLASNGAGLLVSHNAGYGVPDAGFAVDLARRWPNRPPLARLTFNATPQAPIPDDGLRLNVTGDQPVPASLLNIPGTPSLGAHADTAIDPLPIVDVGLASPPITNSLQGKAALIQRGTHLFIDKINAAAQAGAMFAVIYNNLAATERLIMAETDFAPIPALFITQNAGDALRNQLSLDPSLRVGIAPVATLQDFVVTNTLLCEHVGLRVNTTHSRRGDLRLTLLSPAGTRSVLQRINNDSTPGPSNWTYYSVHHFLEPSRGRWQVQILDELPLNTGSLAGLELILHGTPIADTDADGLDDDWEIASFGHLNSGPRDDPDNDGFSNAFEQVLATDPAAPDFPFRLDLSPWNASRLRLSWPGVDNASYQIFGHSISGAAPSLIAEVPGQFPVTESFLPFDTPSHPRFFRVLWLPQSTTAPSLTRPRDE